MEAIIILRIILSTKKELAMTEQQAMIVKIIGDADRHLTADEIFSCAREVMPQIAIGTVYRTLKILSDQGKIRRLPMADSPDRYDKNMHPHDHMTCNECGRFLDIDTEGVQRLIEDEAHIKVSQYELLVHGLCPECKRKHDTEDLHK